MSLHVTACRPEHRAELAAFLTAHDAAKVARRRELVDALDQPALVAWRGDRLAGAATYVVTGDARELLTLHAADRGEGVGSALVAAVRDEAVRAGCTRLWVVTTNDNVDALRFYQRRGFRLDRLRPGAVDMSRDTLKPEIPKTGEHGIPLRDEVELVMTFGS
ncbi:GNAT family N-acetyltransferase [Nocardioides guangzhouensis]|uniref:GNAT family N-acetyltransferase n=1 Tax=Nocardioides guangzhouensis TaxID=2497878 RepID=A0A4Q4Z382_9ACTN|nr:GNAT family N-acetyltransferase [Nocardioides guangzhouensis]RYP81401.1 GNAT family N-acetyltransferase [Nocardioides guangzhouensis]